MSGSNHPGQSSRGQLSEGQYSSGAIILGGNCPGGHCPGGGIYSEAIVRTPFSPNQSFFLRKVQIQTDEIEAYLENITLPKLTNEHTLNCEGIISEDESLRV